MSSRTDSMAVARHEVPVIRKIGPCSVPRRGYRTQPRVSTLGIVDQERRALKGRQIERPKKVGSVVGWSNGRTSQWRTLTFAWQWVRASSGTRISRPFRANRLF